MSDVVQDILGIAETATRPEPLAHNFWKRHPKFHRFMFVVCVIAGIAYTIFLIAFVASETSTNSSSSNPSGNSFRSTTFSSRSNFDR